MVHILRHSQIRRFSQMALERLKTVPRQKLFWKCDENDPTKHNKTHLGLFYQLPEEKELIQIYGYPSPFRAGPTKLYKVWGRMQLMVRQPALTIMDHFKNLEQSDTNTKILLYGHKGNGKGHTLIHLVHYLHSIQDHIIVQIRESRKITRSPTDFNESTSRPGRIDTPFDAALLLQQIRTVNANLFEKYKDTLVCSQDYKWSLREITKAGEPLIKVAEHGVNRVNHASDCVAVMLKELSSAANEGKIKLSAIINDIKWLYQYEAGVIKHADFRKIIVDEMTVPRAIKKLMKNTGTGLSVLASCHDEDSRGLHLKPQEILGDETMELLNDYTQIHVPAYSRQEFENCMNYYQDIAWFARPEARTQEARDELRFISGSNPQLLEYLCRSI